MVFANVFWRRKHSTLKDTHNLLSENHWMQMFVHQKTPRGTFNMQVCTDEEL